MTTVLTIAEAAAAIGRSERLIRRLIATKAIAARKEGGRWYINAASLEAWAACGAEPPAPRGFYRIPAVGPPPLKRRDRAA